MQIENIEKMSKKEMYSIDQYQGGKKWCFAIVLNKAQTNFKENPNLLEQTLIRFEKRKEQDWFDEETKKLIYEKEGENKIKREIQKSAGEKLNNLRNYFSHYFHNPSCLIFTKNDPLRIIMEKAYEKVLYEKVKNQQEDISIEFPELFEENGKITSAGMVFFVSFFIERRFLNRLMGYVQGFRKTEGEYKITREIFSKYCLKDSYSVKTPDHDAVMFRDILGYLSRVPTESYQRIRQPQTRNEGQLSERKTDKFIVFALNYLEDYGLKGLRNYPECFFARSRIKQEQVNVENKDDKKHKPHKGKKRLEIHFDNNKIDPFYISHNNVILKIQKKGGQANVLRVGIYELKYLVLLSLWGKAREAVERIDNYLHDLQRKLPYIEKKNNQEIQKCIGFLPRFVRSRLGLLNIDDNEKVKARLDYIKAKWTEKKEKSKVLEIHRKGRDILRYINERCVRHLNTDEYNHILELLVNKDLAGFYRELEELKKTGRIDKNILRNLLGQESLNALHIKVCDSVLEELRSLEMEKLKEYIGLIPKEEKEVSFKEKINRILSQPVIHKGFLREQFFKEDKKSFAKLVEETMKEMVEGGDIPLGTEHYQIPSLEKFHHENQKLYETLAMDRLCLMMARQYYLSLNKKLTQKAQRIEWKKKNGTEVIIFALENPNQPGQSCSIKFSIWDYTKLYVTDEPEFLLKLFYYFFSKEKKEIEYHKLYTEGLNKYTNIQKEGIEAILELEKKIIKRKNLVTSKSYIEFREIMDKSGYNKNEQDSLKLVRNAFLHYNLDFEKEHLKSFYSLMKREGIEKKWSLAAKKNVYNVC